MPDKVKLTNEQIKTIVAVIMFSGVMGFVYWKYLWSPFSARITAANTKIETINQDIAKANAMAKRLDKLNVEIESLRKLEADTEHSLPKGKKIPDLINTLMAASRKYSVSITGITPQNSSDKQYFTEVNYQMSVTGKYHSIGRFLAALAASKRVFSIQNLNMSGDSVQVSASFTLVVYQYRG